MQDVQVADPLRQLVQPAMQLTQAGGDAAELK